MIRPWYALPFSRALCASMVLAIPSGCGLDQRPGDGLVTDGRQVYVQPSNRADAGIGRDAPPVAEDGGEAPFCKSLDLFVEKVVPQFEAHCTECHDGTKRDAALALAMSFLKSDPELACRTTLALGATQENAAEAEILTSSDPDGTNVEHDFHFDDDRAQFMAYQEEVLPWLMAEKEQ